MRTLADGFTGAIMAAESITDAMVLLHGPGGCRIRHMVYSTAVFPRQEDSGDHLMSPYFCGYPRVPATYLDEYDFVNGAMYKLDEALPIVAACDPGMVVVIDSPGAALIGDDVSAAISESSLSGKAIHMDESLVSEPCSFGYGYMLRHIMMNLAPERNDIRKGTVILLGLSILDKDWRSGRDELIDIVESMGLEVICTPGADASVRQLRESVNAEFGVVVCPEMCTGLSDYYAGLGMQIIRSESGAPVGFDALESWIGAIARGTGADPSKPLGYLDRKRKVIFDKMVGMRYNAVRIRGLTFSIAGTASIVRPLTEWLYSFLAMAPVAVDVDPGYDAVERQRIMEFLDSIDYGHVFGMEPVDSDVVLCEGVEATTMMLSERCRIAIPIGFSSMGIDDVIPRPVYGTLGVFYILDEILHGVRGT